MCVLFLAESAFQASGLKPPHNPAAEVPRDVYNVNDSILEPVQPVSVFGMLLFLDLGQSYRWQSSRHYRMSLWCSLKPLLLRLRNGGPMKRRWN